jgi:hypothetical protein
LQLADLHGLSPVGVNQPLLVTARAGQTMTSSNTTTTEKLLLLVTIGFLEALKAGAIDADEAFHTIGIPSIVGRMAATGISDEVARLIGQLDEFAALNELGGIQIRDASIGEVIGECTTLLKGMPLAPNRSRPLLKLLA